MNGNNVELMTQEQFEKHLEEKYGKESYGLKIARMEQGRRQVKATLKLKVPPPAETVPPPAEPFEDDKTAFPPPQETSTEQTGKVHRIKSGNSTVSVSEEEVKVMETFEGNLVVGQAVLVRWTVNRRFYCGTAEVVSVADKKVVTRLTEQVPIDFADPYPVGREIVSPRINRGVCWSFNNCVVPVGGYPSRQSA